ncbi:MAG TPA: GH92 family glycosyl hydrolase [Mycobacteriales bacterium]|nr:GH92 family glycosyl hydrolase [Mycobacteriales bacterium]
MLTAGAAALVAAALAAAPAASAPASPAHHVHHGRATLTTGRQLVRLADPFVGTDTRLADQGTGGSAGNMSPAATAPFGMLSWGPRTVPDAVAYGAGYTYSDTKISGFDLTRFQGGGCVGFEDVPITPTTTPITRSPAKLASAALDPRLTATFDHRHESASPGRYAVTLNPGSRRPIRVALAAASRAGIGHFRFPANAGTGSLVINAGGSPAGVTAAAVHVDTAARTVTVTETSGRFCQQPTSYTLHVVLRFDRSFASHAVWHRQTFVPGGDAASSHSLIPLAYTAGLQGLPPALPGSLSGTAQAGAVLRFATAQRRSVGVRVGLSYVSTAGARDALEREVGHRSLRQVRRRTATAWARLLGRLRVAGGSGADRRMLATTLYQSMLSPQLISDVDGRFPALNGRVERARSHATYSQMSLWDEYRTHAQLLALLAPHRARDIARSLLDDERYAGYLPRWPVVGGSPDIMVGDPAVPYLADFHAFGVHGFSLKAAVAAGVHGAASNGVDDAPLANLPALLDPATLGGGYYVERPGNPAYLALHYLPIELDATTNTTGGAEALLSPALVWGSASTGLEYATADFALARLATASHQTAVARAAMARANWWRNNFNARDKMVEPRSATGVFLPISKSGGIAHGFVEGDGSQYTFMVPFDVAGLRRELGGSSALVRRLDALFTQLNAGPSSPYAFLGNEPQLDTPYEYLWAGRPDRTESVIARAMRRLYAPAPDGYPGNVDGGTMSAWWVFNAIGIYPAIPGDDVLAIGAPRFSRVTLRAPGGHAIRIVAPQAGARRRYVTAARLHGRPLHRAWLRYSALRHGASLRITTRRAAADWARAIRRAPPSYAPGGGTSR